MSAARFFSFSRRISSIKSLSSVSCTSKLTPYNGYYGYSRNFANRILKNSSCTSKLYQHHLTDSNGCKIIKRSKKTSSDQEKTSVNESQSVEEKEEKLSIFQRYKKMLKEYWYVLLPVHGVTSAFWFGGFYYAASCGLDIVPFLEYINLPEKFIEPLRNSALGYIAVASAFYKLATPARYMVTLGGTTFATKFLIKRGLIRPVPTKSELKTIIQKRLKKDSGGTRS